MARYLIDSHIFLWAAEDPTLLNVSERRMLADPNADVSVSVASIWELSIKWTISRVGMPGGRRPIPANHFADSAAAMGIPILSVQPLEAEYVRTLPQIHRDPFDRLLIAQAVLSGRIMVTRDSVFSRYPGLQLWSPS